MPLLPYVRNAVKTHRITDISHQDITQKSLQDTRCSIGLLHVEAGSGADSSNSDVGDDVIEELRQSTLRLIFQALSVLGAHIFQVSVDKEIRSERLVRQASLDNFAALRRRIKGVDAFDGFWPFSLVCPR